MLSIETSDLSKIVSILSTYGICIIPSVLNDEECYNLANGMFNTFSQITSQMDIPFNYNDSSTWKTLDLLYPKHNMLHQHWGIGQSQFVWDVRCNPKIINCFEQLWQTSNLLVSFDGVSLHLPSEITKKGWFKNSWYHADQSFYSLGPQCVQGLVNGFDTNEGDASLTVLIKSHQYQEEYLQSHQNLTKDDFSKVDDIQFYIDRGCFEHRITCPKGSLVLWDSRTLHFGSEPIKGRSVMNTRAVIYLCYSPREKASVKILEKKKKAFLEQRMTNHWPHNPKLFPKLPRTYGNPLPNITTLPFPIIDHKYAYLIGF